MWNTFGKSYHVAMVRIIHLKAARPLKKFIFVAANSNEITEPRNERTAAIEKGLSKTKLFIDLNGVAACMSACVSVYSCNLGRRIDELI